MGRLTLDAGLLMATRWVSKAPHLTVVHACAACRMAMDFGFTPCAARRLANLHFARQKARRPETTPPLITRLSKDGSPSGNTFMTWVLSQVLHVGLLPCPTQNNPCKRCFMSPNTAGACHLASGSPCIHLADNTAVRSGPTRPSLASKSIRSSRL